MDTMFESLSQFLNSLYGLPGAVLAFLVANCIGYLFKMLDVFPNRWIPIPVVVMAVLANIFLRPPPPDGVAMWQHYVRLGMVGLMIGVAACIFYDKFLKLAEDKWPALKSFLGGASTVILCLFTVGCGSLSAHVFRMEQTSTDLALGGYIGWTNYLLPKLADPSLSPSKRDRLITASNEVKVARMRFAATLSTVESMRETYDTNAAVKPYLEAGVNTMVMESSNVCWLINFWRQQ